MLGYSNDVTTKFKSVDTGSATLKMEDSILSIQDILNSEVPEIPLETRYDVSWIVMNGKQIASLPTCLEVWNDSVIVHREDDLQESNTEIDISVRDSSIHSLSFECELYLNTIKTRMFSDSNTTKGEMYHQLHVDDGLKQILPYLVNWIQSEVSVGDFYYLGATDSENEARRHVVVSGVSDARDAQSGVEPASEHRSLRRR